MARTGTFGGTDGETLTITITEDLSIDARDYGSKQTITIPAIVDVTRRLVTILHTAESVIASSNPDIVSYVAPAGPLSVNETIFKRRTYEVSRERPYEPYGIRTEYGFRTKIPRSKRKRF